MYQIEFTEVGKNDLARLDKTIAHRVLIRLRWLAEKFDFITPEVCKGPWEGLFKFRVGNYRVLYTFDKIPQKIFIHFVRHRREVYRRR